MSRPLFCLLLLSLGLARVAWGAEEAALLRSQIDLEQQLLAEDLKAYADARTQERGAVAGAAEAAAHYDEALVHADVTVDQLGRLEAEQAVARAAVEVTSTKVTGVRASLHERFRRVQALRRELTKAAPAVKGADPISGRWKIEVSSPAETGTLELTLDGAQVTGTYSLSGGRTGSLRGTFVQGRLKLERTDSQKGLDGVFEGTVDVTFGTVRGFWSASRLGEGGPGGSGWSGVRVTPATNR